MRVVTVTEDLGAFWELRLNSRAFRHKNEGGWPCRAAQGMSGFPALLSFGELDKVMGKLNAVGLRSVMNEIHRTHDVPWVVWRPHKSTAENWA